MPKAKITTQISVTVLIGNILPKRAAFSIDGYFNKIYIYLPKMRIFAEMSHVFRWFRAIFTPAHDQNFPKRFSKIQTFIKTFTKK